jgi:ribosomal protein S18 acetylase RimI-like enzyme
MMKAGIEVAALTLAELRADHTGSLIEQVSALIKEVFSAPPWHENLSIARIQFGLGVEMMRNNPLLFVAKANGTGRIIGYLLGQEVCRYSEDPRHQTLSKIAGSNDLDYLFNSNKRIFYVSGIGITQKHRRCGIAEQLSLMLINELRRLGFSYRIGRTDISVQAMRNLYLKQGFQELPVADANYPERTYWLLEL